MTPRDYDLFMTWHLKFSIVMFAVITLAMPALFWSLSRAPDGPPPVIAWIFPIAMLYPWYLVLTTPRRITVHPDGRIEFVSLLSRSAIPASQIQSVQPGGGQIGFLVLRHSGGRIRLLNQFTGFHQLLTELKTASPGIELEGC